MSVKKKVGKIVLMHAMKAYEEVEVQFYSILTSEINCTQAASCPICFTPMDTTLVQLNLELGGSQSQPGCSGKYIVCYSMCKVYEQLLIYEKINELQLSS
jgi:hypothetical protein